MIHPVKDEILEQLWYARETSSHPTVQFDNIAIEELIACGDISKTLELLPAGEEKARGIVRRHRLAEILFTQVLDVDIRDAEKSACEFEHILPERVVDRVCTFLGHPPSCPHGKPIPQGDCCRVYSKKIEPLITRLVDLPLGATGSVVFIAPKSVSRLNRLAAFGVVPGSKLRLIERKPSVVFACGHTSIAVEDEIGKEIYVRVGR
jgi:DtxR family Mn-dependent transcriptional regulator